MLPEPNVFGDKRIKVIRRAGELKTARLEDGKTVHRQLNIYIPDIGLVNCAPYSNHFIFRHLFNNRGWTLFCTCSSPAAVFNYDAYKKDASNEGQLLLCMHHAQYNVHADGST